MFLLNILCYYDNYYDDDFFTRQIFLVPPQALGALRAVRVLCVQSAGTEER